MTKRRTEPRGRAAAAPITAHRLFPAMTALWFAALFGLGSFAVSVALLEALVTATGLAALVPAAAPPLGFTARLLLALLLTALGGLAGLLVGLRLRGHSATPAHRRTRSPGAAAADEPAPKVRARDAHPDAPPRRPLVLTEEFIAEVEPLEGAPAEDSASFAAPVAAPEAQLLPGRRRALTVPEPDPLDLHEIFPFAMRGEPVPHPDWTPEVVPATATEAGEPAEAQVDALPDALPGTVEDPMDEPAPEFTPEPEADMPAEQGDEPSSPAPIAAAVPQPPVTDRPLETLGLVQLIERLAIAIAARRTARAQALAEEAEEAGWVREPVVAADAPAAPEQPEPVAVETEAEAIAPPAPVAQDAPAEETPAAPFLPPQQIVRLRAGGAALQPLVDEDDDLDAGPEVIVPRFLSLHHPAVEPPASEPAAPAPVLPAVLPHGRIEVADPEADTAPGIEPVVVFPGQGSRDAGPFARPAASAPAPQVFAAPPPPPSALPDAEEADRALRAALATLQRMTAKG